MTEQFVVELTLAVEVQDLTRLSDQAIHRIDGMDWTHDPDGEQRAQIEQTLRSRPDQALQSLLHPRSVIDGIDGTVFVGGDIVVRSREAGERLPWEPGADV